MPPIWKSRKEKPMLKSVASSTSFRDRAKQALRTTLAAITTSFVAIASANATVTLRSPDVGGTVSRGGETLFGTVSDPASVLGLMVRVNAGRQTYVSVDAKTGQYAVRLVGTDTTAATVSVDVTAVRELGPDDPQNFRFTVGASTDAKMSMLSRITFGLSPALLRRVEPMSFTAYLDEQLNPGTIPDTAFLAMNPSAMLKLNILNDWERDSAMQRWRIALAAYSDKQLQVLMAVFWENHFWSVPKRQWLIDGQVTEFKNFYTYGLGRFEDLLLISMKSPVMMDFLDNAASRKDNITENYARELLELHTVGVDGGYTNNDIRAVANILTGWTLEEVDHPQVADPERKLVVFKFDPQMHDSTARTVPFINFSSPSASGAGAISRGVALARALAKSPKTHKFVCGKLVAQFISEDKPASAVKVCTDAWLASDGRMSVILRALLTSPDFASPANMRNKAKTPFEYVVGTIRNFGLYEKLEEDRDWAWEMSNILESAGMNLKSYPVPTGFKEQTTKWLSTASMNGRMRKVTNLVAQEWSIKRDYAGMMRAAGLRAPEAMAAYLMTIATADRYRLDEFQAVVEALRGSDRMINPDDPEDVKRSVERALSLIVTLPSYQIQ
jgi:large repetitive protein